MNRGTQTPDEPASIGDTSRTNLLRAAAGLAIAGRFLVPTEAAVLSPTPGGAAADGWLSILSLAAVAVWAVGAWRNRTPVRWGAAGWCLLGLTLAHAAAAVPVLTGGGNRRGAVEVVLNWAGVTASFFLLRQLWRPGDGVRFAAVAVACTVAAAGLGAWQVAVTLPADRAAYVELRDRAAELETDLADRSPRLSSTTRARGELAAVRSDLAAAGVPEDPAGRKRWEDRLLGSREPTGPFALANTLAGVLLFGAILCGGLWRGGRAVNVVAGLAAVGLVGVLILTKSRTGYVGLAAGLAVWAAARWAGGAGRANLRRGALAAAVAAALLIGGVIAAAAAGFLDREVLSEAPRSLAFRLQYWTGTLRALADRPLLGAGPANLRPFYLLHKEAAASESIAAPHNLVLDFWASGGLLAPLLAAALAWCGVRRWRGGAEPARSPAPDGSRWDPLFSGVPAAFGIVAGAGFVLGEDLRDLAGLGLAALPAAAVLYWCGGNRGGGTSHLGPVWAGAAAGLAVHLLGADGAEFPAVLTLFVLALAAAPPGEDVAGRAEPAGRGAAAAGLLSAAVAGAAVWFVVLPGRTAGGLLTDAELAAAAGRDPRPALIRAAAADPLSDAPARALAEVATARSLADPADIRARRRAVAAWADYRARGTRDGAAERGLSELFRAAGDWGRAAESDAAAVALDPSAAAPRARLAESAAAAGDTATARAAAVAALVRDDLTRAAGHADRVLPADVRARVERLADGIGAE